MKIKKKVIFSNILSFIIPVLVGIIASYMAIKNLDARMNKLYMNDYMQAVENIDEDIRKGDYDNLYENIINIEENGYLVKLIIKDEEVYRSPNYDMHGIHYIDNSEKNILELDSVEVLDNYNEMVTARLGDYSENNYLLMINMNKTYDLKEEERIVKQEYNYFIRSMILVVVAVIGSVVLTTMVVSYVINKSIMKPLKLLVKKTNEISEGNLEDYIEYYNDDEFKQVFDDFEEMRENLLKSKLDSEKLENNRKELIAGITHDLNTPLTSIKGYTKGLLDGIADNEEKRVNYLQKIDSSTSQMSELIDQLFIYSKLDVNSIKFTYIRTNITQYFEDCISDIGLFYKEKGLNIVLEDELEDKNTYVLLDLINFRRAVLNILNNSLKYKSKNIGNMHIIIRDKFDDVEIIFRDDGIGVAKDEIAEIFNIFYRVEKSRNKKTGGSGLGLAIVKNIVEGHGGEIQVNEEYIDGLELSIILKKEINL